MNEFYPIIMKKTVLFNFDPPKIKDTNYVNTILYPKITQLKVDRLYKITV